MTADIALLLVLLSVSVALFWLAWTPPDVVALGLVLALVVTGLVPAERAFQGFGSDTVIMFLGLLILTSALLRTGVVEIAGRAILRHTGEDGSRVLLVVMIAAAALSAFISNTAATAFFLPIVSGIAARTQVSPSTLLMPLAFASICSSSVTLVSTSTNLVVSGVMTQYGLAPLGMFELSPVGVPIAVLCIVYMFFVGRHLLGRRAGTEHDIRELAHEIYFTEVLVPPASPLAGRTIAESRLEDDLDLRLVRLVRAGERHLIPRDDVRLEAGDVLLVEGRRDDVLRVKDRPGVEIKSDVTLAGAEGGGEGLDVVEVILMPRNPLIGRTLKRAKFREAYGLQVLGVQRRGEVLGHEIRKISLGLGDMLLIQGPRSSIRALAEDDSFKILGVVEEARTNPGRAAIAVTLFAGAIAVAAAGLLPFSVAAMLGAFLAFVTGCITPQEAYREVEWQALVLVGCMLALGIAMESTGAAKYLAGSIAGVAGALGPLGLLAAFFVATVALTQPMSNQAAAIVLLPVTIETARTLGFDPRPFAIMIAVAASCSYLTPLEPSCLLVFGPGRYRFSDFLKVGSLLTVLILAASMFLVPIFWPLR